MDIEEYKSKVISFFKDGKATDKHYGEMAEAILFASESNNCKSVRSIDKAIGAEGIEDDIPDPDYDNFCF